MWSPVPNFPGYAIDRITQQVHGPRKILTPRPDRRGRVWIALYRNGVQYNHKLAHLMLITFVGLPEPGQVSRHLDDDPGNNALENLCWGTQSENMYDKVANGLHWNTNKTHCKYGHLFDEVNTAITTDGRRRCRRCAVNRTREHRQRVGR